jgi:hypothetical protein
VAFFSWTKLPGLFPDEKAIDRKVVDLSPLEWIAERDQEEGAGGEDTTRCIERPHVFEGKPVVFISARVHPGELPAQYTFDGALDFILSSKVRHSRRTLTPLTTHSSLSPHTHPSRHTLITLVTHSPHCIP